MNTQQKTNNQKNKQNPLAKLKTLGTGEGSKACLFNLIVYTPDFHRKEYFQEIIKMITSRFPCRIFFIRGSAASKKNGTETQIHSETIQTEQGFSCDQIFIEVSDNNINQVNSLLLSLLVPDLPIYLLWGLNPNSDDVLLPLLTDFATRLIFDSETSEDLHQFSLDMLKQIESSSIQIIDMNWVRIEGWREIMAQVFDSPERFDQLVKSTDIQMYYNDKPSQLFFHHDTQAIYLQAWLASRLGWQFQKIEKNKKTLLHYQSAQSQHRIELIPVNQQDFETEEILEIKIQGPDGYECNLKRSNGDQIEMQACNQYQCELPLFLRIPNLRSGRSFMQEIFYQKTSDQYVAMLKLISLVPKWS